MPLGFLGRVGHLRFELGQLLQVVLLLVAPGLDFPGKPEDFGPMTGLACLLLL